MYRREHGVGIVISTIIKIEVVFAGTFGTSTVFELVFKFNHF
jgi:hypothetical protein